LKEKPDNAQTNAGPVAVKRNYRPPVLQRFGLVAELTKDFASDCRNDGESCGAPPNNMGRKAGDTEPIP